MGSNGTTVDTLQIKIEADAKKAISSLKSLNKSLSKLNKTISSFGNNKDFEKGIKAINQSTKDLAKNLNSIDGSKLKTLAKVLKSVSKSANASAKDIQNAVNKINQATNNANKNTPKKPRTPRTPNIPNNQPQVPPSNTQVPAQPPTNQPSNQNKPPTSDIEESIKQYKERLRNLNNSTFFATEGFKAFNEVANRVSASVDKVGKSIRNAFGKAASIISKCVGAVRKLHSQFGLLGKSANKSGLDISKMLKSILRYGLGIRSVFVLTNKIRRAFEVGSNNLVQFSDSYNRSISSLVNSLTKLKNAFAVGFAPIVQIVIPYLVAFINAISKALNLLAQFFGYLTGKSTVPQAVDVFDDYAAGLESASGSAKKLNAQLQGFDKLNNLTSSNGGGGSGGSGGTKPEDMFKNSAISEAVKKWAEKLKDAWRKADFTEIGKIISDKLYNALDSINWNKIKKVAFKIGKSIATFINGFVNPKLFGKIGESIAEGINTALRFANGFIKNLDFSNIGKSIAEGINRFLKRIDWRTALDNMASLGKGIANAINSFMERADFTEIGKAIANYINLGVEFAFNLISRIDFAKFGDSISKALNSSISNIKWAKAGKSLGKAIQGIIKALGNFVKKTNWRKLGESFRKLIRNALKEIKASDFKALLKGIVQGILDFISGITGMKTGTIKAIAVAIGYLWLQIKVFKGMTAIGSSVMSFVGTMNKLRALFGGGQLASSVASTASATTSFSTAIGGLSTTALPVIGVIAALAGVIALVATNIPDENGMNWCERYAQKLNGVSSAVKDVKDDIESLNDVFDEQMSSGQANYDYNDTLIDQYERLASKTSLTSDEKKKLADITKDLIDAFPELEDALTGEAGNYKEIVKQLRNANKEQLESIKLDAQKEKLKGLYADLAEAQKTLSKEASDYKTINDELIQKQTEFAEKSKDPNFFGTTEFEQLNTEIRNLSNEVDTYKKDMQSYANSYDSVANEINDITSEIYGINDAVSSTDVIYGEIGETVDGVTTSWKDYAKAQENASKKEKALDDRTKITNRNLKKYFPEIQKGVGKTADAYNSFSDTTNTTSKKVENDTSKVSKKTSEMTKSANKSTLDWQYQADKSNSAISKSYDKTKTSLKGVGTMSETVTKKLSSLFKYNNKSFGIKPNTSGINNFTDSVDDLTTSLRKLANYNGKKFTVEIKSASTGGTDNVKKKAKGGSFFGGSWHKIQQYASGGVVNHGSVFVAGEHGSEIVGNIGGRTEVLNQSQLASVMYDAVVNGMMVAMKSSNTNVNVTLEGDAQGLFNAVRKADNQYKNQNGHSAFVY